MRIRLQGHQRSRRRCAAAHRAVPVGPVGVGACCDVLRDHHGAWRPARVWVDDATNVPDVERRFMVPPPVGMSFENVNVSPDGRHLAFTAAPNRPQAKTKLWVQALDSLEARELADTDDASLPFWSPASDALGFFAEGHLWTVTVAGGSPQRIAVAPQGSGGTWNRDGTILFAPGFRGVLSRVDAGGGAATPVTTLAHDERGHVWPEFLPDGRHFVYVSHAGHSDPKGYPAYVSTLDGSWRRRVLTTETGVLNSADGYLYFVRKGQLFAQRYDVQQFEPKGEPLALASRRLEDSELPLKGQFSVSSTAVVTYRTRQSPATRLVWRDRAGRTSAFVTTPADYTEPTLAPDETRVAYDVFDPNPSERFGYGPARVRGNIVVLDRAKGVSIPLTSNPAGAWAPVWSPDGRSIVFSTHRGEDTLELAIKDAADPAAVERSLTTIGALPGATSWSPDGRFILYTAFDVKTRTDVYLLPMSGNRTPIPLIHGESAEYQAQISPNGRWVAYASDESGRAEVYVQTFPTLTTKRKISSAGGADPRLAPRWQRALLRRRRPATDGCDDQHRGRLQAR